MKPRVILFFMTSKIRLIALYDFIYECYNNELKWHCQRFSPNGNQGLFTDEELLTCYLFSIIEEDKFMVKKSYQYIQKYWIDWFPNLHSYQAFNRRLNRLSPLLKELVALLSQYVIEKQEHLCSDLLIDSFPVQLSSGKRPGKVAKAVSNKGYCATKKMYYHGVKCHIMGMSRANTLPVPVWMDITPAATHDITPLKAATNLFHQCRIFADKAYGFDVVIEPLKRQGCQVITPPKPPQKEPKWEKQWNGAFRKQCQSIVSQVRQPIESLFNWLNEKSNIQDASKVRSEQGLWVHIFGKISASLLIMGLF